MSSAAKLIRISAFLRKEIFEIIRQPMLVVTLVLGPFLILLFFGIGYQNQAQDLRTLFVVSEGSPMIGYVEEYATTLGEQLVYSGVVTDLNQAQLMLRDGEVDLVTQVPDNPLEALRNNRQSSFLLYHKEIDPFRSQYVDVFGRVYVNEINRRVLRFITVRGQTDLLGVETQLDAARLSIQTVRELLELCTETLTDEAQRSVSACNSETVRQRIIELDQRIDELELQTGDKARLIDSLDQALNISTDDLLAEDMSVQERMDELEEEEAETERSLSELIDNTKRITELSERADTYLEQLQLLTELESDLNTLERKILEFIQLDPDILTRPFRFDSRSLAVTAKVSDFFAPGVIALLLQHLTVTFAALSMVRERQLGTIELFYISPLSALEILLGKYLSYLLFGGFLATVLLLLVIHGMGVPMLGRYEDVALTLILLIFASLGVGFIISLLSQTDTQAVQYSMIFLLVSVFFSGFILSLGMLRYPVSLISRAIPVTYGIELMRAIMLQGAPLPRESILLLALYGIVCFLIAWWMLRRSMVKL